VAHCGEVYFRCPRGRRFEFKRIFLKLTWSCRLKEKADISVSLPGQRLRRPEYYNRFLPDFFAAAQRPFIASAIRLRAAADMPRRRAGVDLPPLPGWRPRRLTPDSPPLSRARMAPSNLLPLFLQRPNDLVNVHPDILAFTTKAKRVCTGYMLP
jgi:hypothetical protein